MKIILAGVLGGLIAFVWSAVAHMNPLTGMLGLSMLNQNEDAVLGGLKMVKEPGLYFFPGIDMSKEMTPAVEEAWTAKYKAGPAGLLLIHPNGRNPMEPKQLIIEFVSCAFCGWIAALILSTTVGKVVCRATMVMMMGVFAWVALSISHWNWYGYPFGFIAVDLIDQSIGWFLAGLLIARMIKPAVAPTAAQPQN